MRCRKSQRDVELYSKAASSVTSLLAAFSRCSSLGVAILDDELHCLAVNKALAAMKGVVPEAHVSRIVLEVMGELSQNAEPKMERVFATGQHISTCLAGTLPNRAEPGQCIAKILSDQRCPGPGEANRGYRCGGNCAHKAARESANARGERAEHAGGKLRDSIRQYQFALGLILENLLRHTSRLEQRGKQFEQAIVALDQRVAAMQEFVASVSPQI